MQEEREREEFNRDSSRRKENITGWKTKKPGWFFEVRTSRERGGTGREVSPAGSTFPGLPGVNLALTPPWLFSLKCSGCDFQNSVG